MRRRLIGFVKFLTANVVASLIFSGVGYFYYFGGLGIEPPIADEVWKRATPNGRVSRYVEGAVCIRLDANGYNNEYYRDANRDLADVDALVMGSSHVEGFNLNKPFVYLLNERFADSEGTKSFYQCGASSHTFDASIARYEDAVKLFRPKRYVLVEACLIPDLKEIRRALNDEFENRPAPVALRPWFARVWGLTWGIGRLNQYFAFRAKRAGEENASTVESREALEAGWTALARRVVEISRRYGARPIFFFHLNANLGENGEYLPRPEIENLPAFRAICEREGIVFVDATERFRREYEENDVWHYGFGNAGIISGHLNRDGHRAVADVLEETIRKLDAQKKENESEKRVDF